MTITDRPATGQDRRALHAYVTDGAHDDWHNFAASQGVSVSGLLEALTSLGTFTVLTPDSDPEAVRLGRDSLAEHMARVVGRARVVDAVRRRRTRR